MFDPFEDFEQAGYLRNRYGEKDLQIVQELEHQLFRAGLDQAIAHLAKRRRLGYDDFLAVHRILFSAFYPWAGQDRAATAPDIAVTKAGTWFSHPADARRAVEEGLRIARDKRQFRQRSGEVMGLFAYGHPSWMAMGGRCWWCTANCATGLVSASNGIAPARRITSKH